MNANTKPVTMEAFTLAWNMAKQEEADANTRRLAIEQQIVAMLPAAEVEDTQSTEVADYRVSVKYGVTRKVDTVKLQGLWESLPAAAQKAFRWKSEVDTKNLRALKEFAPADYARVVGVLETKPSKPSVTVTPIEREAA